MRFLFYFIPEKINQEYIKTGMQECALYCTGCAFVTDATQQHPEKECLSSSNKELNRLAKLSITDFPLIQSKDPEIDPLENGHSTIIENKLERKREMEREKKGKLDIVQ